MKKVIIILIVVISLASGGYYYYNKIYLPSLKPTIEVEKNSATITKYYIYGTHLNIEGNIKKINANFTDASLILWNSQTGTTQKYKINYSKNINNLNFNISDEINTGIYLDSLKTGTYNFYLRLTYENKEPKYKYYPLENKTEYPKTTYYTTSSQKNKIEISTITETLSIKIKSTKQDSYDIVLDPSCGGIDKGTTGNGYNESDITLSLANKVKENLESQNLKVKLTRTEESLSSNEYFEEYNEGGRAIIPYEVHTKYIISFETTSSTNQEKSGFSVYTPANINYSFAARLVENIIEKTNLKTTSNTNYRIDYGIYTHNFTENEIQKKLEYYDSKGYKRYNVTTNSNYLYMIRETGGIITGAYIDESNPEKIGVNPYYNSNIGAEAYVINLGYLTNINDITAMTINQDNYATAISEAIIEELTKNK